MYEQQEFEITYSNTTKLDFIRCRDCDQEPICPHAGYRDGCRTKERLLEVKGGKIPPTLRQDHHGEVLHPELHRLHP